MEPTQIAMIVALILSVVIHEMAHGYAANWLGDPTARLQGRLSANPLVHLDPMMSVLVPALLIVSGSPLLFGAAKPVPYNPYNFNKHQKYGEAIVAAAGPTANVAIAIVFAILIRSAETLSLSGTFVQLSVSIIILNLFLALFNLVPIPPLDGSKILPRLLPFSLAMKYENFRRYFEQSSVFGFALVIFLFVFVFGGPVYSLTQWLAVLLIGV